MRKAITILFFCMSAIYIQAQENVDSLINLLSEENLTLAQKTELYLTISDMYFDNDIEKSIQYCEKGIAITKEKNDKLNESKFLNSLSMLFLRKGNFEMAHIYIEQALDAAIDSKDTKRQVNVLYGHGTIFLEQANYNLAVEYLIKALELSDQIGYTDIKSFIFTNLGTIHSILKNNDRAMSYLNQAKESAERINDNYSKMGIYQAICNYHYENNDFDKAMSYAQQAYDLSVSPNEDKRYQALSLCNMALLYEKFGEFDNALQCANEALQISQELGLTPQIIVAYNVLSNIYNDKKMYEKSLEFALKGWELDSTSIQESTNFALNITISNLYLDNKDEAVNFFWKYNKLKGQLAEKESLEALANMEVKYETEKKEIRIAVLEKENLYYIWFGATGIALLLLAFSALFYRHRLIRQKRKVAEQQNELSEQKIKQLEQEKLLIATQAVLDGETAERSRLAKDLHNRLGGLLTVTKLNLKEISSYPALEQQDVGRYNKALKLLDQSAVELRSIAHHLMPDSLMRYGLRSAIEDFCNAINMANFTYYGNDVRLDERLEIVLYQGAYELVNNAIKYAEATTINVQLMIDNGLASLTVQDNGKGFDTDETTSGTGLENIQTRVSAYDGKMIVRSSPGNGTEISIEFENIKMPEM